MYRRTIKVNQKQLNGSIRTITTIAYGCSKLELEHNIKKLKAHYREHRKEHCPTASNHKVVAHGLI